MNQIISALLNTPKRLILDNVIKCRSHKNVDHPDLESFLSGNSAQYIEDMYNIWLKDPSKVHASWDAFFRNSTNGNTGYYPPPTLGMERIVSPPVRSNIDNTPVKHENTTKIATPGIEEPASSINPVVLPKPAAPLQQSAGGSSAPAADELAIEKVITVQTIIRGYQVRGHFLSHLDPLGRSTHSLSRISKDGRLPPDVISSVYKVDENDLQKKFKLPRHTSIGGKDTHLTLQEILNRLEKAYCEHIGVEYMFIPYVDQCDWIRKKFEPPGATEISTDKKKLTLARLGRARLFENFCSKKYPSEKRFGLDGLESMIPCIKTIIDRSSELGVEMFVIGMAHRGRLNVLANICHKSLVHMFAFFEPLKPSEPCAGDVKYHLGVYMERMNRVTNKNIKIALIPNPSHLSCGFPAVLGKVKAEQFFRGDLEGKKVMAILIHGDAAFTGQGVNFELLNLSELPCYTTHGTIHIVANNQIGFTTDHKVQRSSPYCTDISRAINAPVLHVNADHPEKVVYVGQVASEWRSEFHRDVVIDLVGYRRYGHQEVDDPLFTQPVLYKQIQNTVPCFDKYAQKLIEEKVVTENEINEINKEYVNILETEFQKSKLEKQLSLLDWLDTPWEAYSQNKDTTKMNPTGIAEDTLDYICKKVSNPPPESAKFVLPKGLQRVLKGRQDMRSKRLVDWSMGEACAFGSLLKEGIPVRMTGQDVERGTFSHRHHIYHHADIENETYNPLQHLYPDQAAYTVCNSSLAEYGILGYEHGYSFVNPNALVIWEAQFGDFANTGQAIFDQMISAAEDKWQRVSGFVAYLPHGMEGAGSEHSSCRPERILDLVSEDSGVMPRDLSATLQHIKNINWIVTNCSTAANHFHALRRQIMMPFRKPMMMMTPKALLRHPEAKSSFDEMREGTEFIRVIPDQGPAAKEPNNVDKLLLCTGKVYYNVRAEIKKKNLDSKIAMVRIEQLAPFPFDLVKNELQKYTKAKVCWLQEEHKNQGFWDHLEPRLRTILRALNDSRDISYIGRAVSPVPATGFRYKHEAELKQLLEDATKL